MRLWEVKWIAQTHQKENAGLSGITGLPSRGVPHCFPPPPIASRGHTWISLDTVLEF